MPKNKSIKKKTKIGKNKLMAVATNKNNINIHIHEKKSSNKKKRARRQSTGAVVTYSVQGGGIPQQPIATNKPSYPFESFVVRSENPTVGKDPYTLQQFATIPRQSIEKRIYNVMEDPNKVTGNNLLDTLVEQSINPTGSPHIDLLPVGEDIHVEEINEPVPEMIQKHNGVFSSPEYVKRNGLIPHTGSNIYEHLNEATEPEQLPASARKKKGNKQRSKQEIADAQATELEALYNQSIKTPNSKNHNKYKKMNSKYEEYCNKFNLEKKWN